MNRSKIIRILQSGIIILMMLFCMPAYSDSEIEISAFAEPDVLAEAGDVTISFTVSNYSDFELHDLELLHEGESLYVEGMEDCVIPPGGTAFFSVEHWVDERELGYGQEFTVRFTRYGEYFDEEIVLEIGREEDPVISLSRKADRESAREGDTIIVTYVLRNDTIFDMDDVCLFDDELTEQAIIDSANLNAGASITEKYEYEMGRSSVRSAPYVTYRINGRQKTFSGIRELELSPVSSGLSLSAEQGDTLATGTSFQVLVKNTGSTSVTGISLCDEYRYLLSETSFSLEPGESRSISAVIAPNADGTTRSVMIWAVGTDEFGEECAACSDRRYEILPSVRADDVSLTLNAEITAPWSSGTGTVGVRFCLINDSKAPLINFEITDEHLGTIERLQTMNESRFIVEKVLSLGSPVNLRLYVSAVDDNGTKHSFGPYVLPVAYNAEIESKPAALPEPRTDYAGLLEGIGRKALFTLEMAFAVILILGSVWIFLSFAERRWSFLARSYGNALAAVQEKPRTDAAAHRVYKDIDRHSKAADGRNERPAETRAGRYVEKVAGRIKAESLRRSAEQAADQLPSEVTRLIRRTDGRAKTAATGGHASAERPPLPGMAKRKDSHKDRTPSGAGTRQAACLQEDSRTPMPDRASSSSSMKRQRAYGFDILPLSGTGTIEVFFGAEEDPWEVRRI